MSADTEQRLEAALAWAARGVRVLPIQRAGKAPLTRHGLHDASTDPDVLRRWWARWPGANVAIATAAPGVDVLDVDVRGQRSGWAALRKLRDAGVLPVGAPLARTPSFINGRFGLLFAVCDESCWAVVRSLIRCYHLVVIDVRERHLLRWHVGGAGGVRSCRAAASGWFGLER